MSLFSDDSDPAQAYDQVTQSPYRAEFPDEVLAAAAAYEAAKVYEKHCAEQGKPDSQAEALELVTGVARAFINMMVERKGLDYIDRKKAEHSARAFVAEAMGDNY